MKIVAVVIGQSLILDGGSMIVPFRRGTQAFEFCRYDVPSRQLRRFQRSYSAFETNDSFLKPEASLQDLESYSLTCCWHELHTHQFVLAIQVVAISGVQCLQSVN